MLRLPTDWKVFFTLLWGGVFGCHGGQLPSGQIDTLPSIASPELTAPIADIDAASRVRLGIESRISGESSSDPHDYPLTYDWSCSEGSTSDTSVFEITFWEIGTVECTLVLSSESGLSSTASVSIEVHEDDAIWTVMVFVNGDNDLEAAGLGDINEMESVGSTPDVNVVVQFDRSPEYSANDGNWDGARRYYIEADEDDTTIGSAVVSELGAVDSGAAETVVEFVQWAVESYPAERYALVFWNHGWGWSLAPEHGPFDDLEPPVPGWSKGLSSDASTGNYLSVALGDFEAALQGATDAIGGSLDLLGIDACVMASWEVAHVAAPFAEVMVASQADEAWDGWPYHTWLADLIEDPNMAGDALGSVIAQRFNEIPDATLSAVDLSTLNLLDEAIDQLAATLLDDDDGTTVYLTAAVTALSFESYTTERDLGNLLSGIAARSPTDGNAHQHASETLSVLEGLVIANFLHGNEVQGATGLTIHAPTSADLSATYRSSSWAADTLWDDFLDAALAP
jgi:hypothetical protein